MEIVKKNKTETIVASFVTSGGVGVPDGTVTGSAWKKTADAENGYWWNGSAWVASYATFSFTEKSDKKGYYSYAFPTADLIDSSNEEVSIFIRAVLTGGTGTAMCNVLEQELKVGGLADELVLARQGVTNTREVDADANKEYLYDDTGTGTPILEFDLLDENAQPATVNVYKRSAV